MMRGTLALGLGAALCACGGSGTTTGDNEPQDPPNLVPGTALSLVTEDGLDHGPVTEVAVEQAEQLSVAAGETIYVKAVGVFEDGYQVDVTEHTYFAAAGSIQLKSRDEAQGVPVVGMAEGTGEITLILGTLDQPTVNITVTPALFKRLEVAASAETLARGTTAFVAAQGTWGDGTTRIVTEEAVWTSSDEAVATVSTDGVVSGLADGEATITATFEGLTAELNVSVACVYPEAGDLVRAQETLPNISWSNAFFPGNPITSGPFNIKDVYCGDNGFDGYKTIFVQISAEWCVPCRTARGIFSRNQRAFINNDVLPVFMEIENRQARNEVTSEGANASMSQELPDEFGIRVGDLDADNVFSRSGRTLLNAFPTMLVIRVSDMKVVASSRDQYQEFFEVYEDILENPEWDWSDLTNPIR